jgi:lysozyme family protein
MQILTFDEAAPRLLKIEAGYSNNPADSGGETNWGITVAVARAFGYLGSMQDMTKAQALIIYRKRYWDAMMLDSVAAVSGVVAEEMFDTGVNMGIDVAGFFLQRSLNLLNRKGSMYADIATDGRIGPMTIAALQSYLRGRPTNGEIVLLRTLNAQQGERYLKLAESREKDEEFVFGWFLNRVK